jgi:hypothetical protein
MPTQSMWEAGAPELRDPHSDGRARMLVPCGAATWTRPGGWWPRPCPRWRPTPATPRRGPRGPGRPGGGGAAHRKPRRQPGIRAWAIARRADRDHRLAGQRASRAERRQADRTSRTDDPTNPTDPRRGGGCRCPLTPSPRQARRPAAVPRRPGGLPGQLAGRRAGRAVGGAAQQPPGAAATGRADGGAERAAA